MISPTPDNLTEEELQRLEAFHLASPALREEMIRTYEMINGNAEGDEIRESCERILEVLKGDLGD